jgi:vesicle transport protein SEC22
VLVVVITKLQFPESLAMSYLSELHDEFTHIHLKEMNASKQRGEMMKPYQYMSFETFITKTKRVYADSRAKDGLHDVNNQLNDVKNIMNKNINDLLNRGENLNNLQDLSSSLREQSVKYKKYAKKINWDLLIKQYAPVAVVALVFLLLIYRWFF